MGRECGVAIKGCVEVKLSPSTEGSIEENVLDFLILRRKENRLECVVFTGGASVFGSLAIGGKGEGASGDGGLTCFDGEYLCEAWRKDDALLLRLPDRAAWYKLVADGVRAGGGRWSIVKSSCVKDGRTGVGAASGMRREKTTGATVALRSGREGLPRGA